MPGDVESRGSGTIDARRRPARPVEHIKKEVLAEAELEPPLGANLPHRGTIEPDAPRLREIGKYRFTGKDRGAAWDNPRVEIFEQRDEVERVMEGFVEEHELELPGSSRDVAKLAVEGRHHKATPLGKGVDDA